MANAFIHVLKTSLHNLSLAFLVITYMCVYEFVHTELICIIFHFGQRSKASAVQSTYLVHSTNHTKGAQVHVEHSSAVRLYSALGKEPMIILEEVVTD